MATNMAGEKKNENKSKCLQPSDIQLLVKLPPTQGKEVLAEKLGIPPYLDTEDPQKAPFISYIYDSVIFATEKGFPWPHISLVIQFAHQFLKGILIEEHQLPDALRDFKKKSSLLEPLNDRHKKQYVDFMFDTVLSHYHLYKYVFSRLRDTIKPRVSLEVTVPSIPPPLGQGQSVNVWEYEQRLKEVEKKGEEAIETLKEEKLKAITDSTEIKTPDDLADIPLPYSRAILEPLVREVLKSYAEIKEKDLRYQGKEMMEDLNLKLEKTVVPRPQVLGSPPRFKPRSPTGGKKSMNNNALKVEKGASSARSVKSKSGRASVVSTKSNKSKS